MKNRFSQMAILICQKIAYVLLGLVLSLVLLEAGLRLGGFVLSSIQEYGNLQSIKQKGAYRILCLGESSTAGQYPHLLEQVLNQRHIGVRFSVIDEGRDGANTLFLLSRVESYLAEYHPDMVIAMMGINDERVKYYEDIPESDTWLFKHCRIYRLGRMLCMHISKKNKREGIYGLSGSYPGRKAKEMGRRKPIPEEAMFTGDNPKNDDAYVELWRLYQRQSKLSQTKEMVEKAIEINPKKDDAYVGLGRVYLKKGKLSQGESFLKKALEFNPKNADAYVEFARLYHLQGKISQAEDSLKKAIELNPGNDDALLDLGWLYRNQGKFYQAEDIFKKDIEINPKNERAYMGLEMSFRDQGEFQQAEDSLKKAIELDPVKISNFLELALLFRAQGKFSEAENVLRTESENRPSDDRVHAAMSLFYEEMGETELAQEYAAKVNRLRSENASALTAQSYRKLKAILDGKGIKLVCMQYPVRNIEPLKKIFGKDEGVIFLDNESVFKDALKKSGYNYMKYFRDMFGGDFGHCTPKGNMLLAQNIADVILREVFNKR